MVYLPPPVHISSEHEGVLCREPQPQAQTSIEQARRFAGSTTLCHNCVRVLRENDSIVANRVLTKPS